MIVTVDECVCCPPEMGCLGAACPNLNVERHVCGKCREPAEYEFEGEELCADCFEERLNEAWSDLSAEEKAEIYGADFEKIDD